MRTHRSEEELTRGVKPIKGGPKRGAKVMQLGTCMGKGWRGHRSVLKPHLGEGLRPRERPVWVEVSLEGTTRGAARGALEQGTRGAEAGSSR